MVDPGILSRRLLALNEALRHLQRPEAGDAGMLLKDPVLCAAVERWVQLAVEACIDLAYHVIADAGLPAPPHARAAFERLVERGIISFELAQRLARAGGMRNILVHNYWSVDLETLARVVRSDLGDLRSFGAAVAALLPPATP